MDVTMTIMSAPAILGLVNLFKQAGLPAKLAPLAALVAAVGIAVTQTLYGSTPMFQSVADAVLLALSACGLYDIAATVGRSARESGGSSYAPERMAEDA